MRGVAFLPSGRAIVARVRGLRQSAKDRDGQDRVPMQKRSPRDPLPVGTVQQSVS